MKYLVRATWLALTALTILVPAAQAADQPLKVGFILPMTGPFAGTGRQTEAAIKLFMASHGDSVAGRKIEILIRDDTGIAPDTTKRLAQELIINDKVEILAGFGLTPLAFAAAPVATEAKVPMIVTAAGTSAIVSRSPFILRTSFTLPQVTSGIAEWAFKNGIKKVFTMVTDYGPGIDSEGTFKKVFTAAGGTIAGEVRMPLLNADYAPFVQRAKDAQPDAVFTFVPSGEGAALMKQFAERGLTQAGIKLIGTGDVTDDDTLDSIGPVALGMVTSHHYSAAHPSAENKAFVADFEKANKGMRPNFMAVGGYDGMNLIYETLKKTSGATGEKFVDAAKTLNWTSVRGPVKMEPETRDITQTVYIRKVESLNGKLYNVEFDSIPMVKDPNGGK